MSTSKKICWVTATYFLDVDIPVIPTLKKYYNIDWIIITNSRNKNDDINYIQSKCPEVEYTIVVDDNKFYAYKRYKFYRKFIYEIASKNYDLYYFDLNDYPYFFLILSGCINLNKIIVAAHNVVTPRGARYYYIARIYMHYVLKVYKNFHVFSESQKVELLKKNPNSDVLYAPLCLKDYGISKQVKQNTPIVFLFFGNIVKYKRLDLLINAALILEKRYHREFIIRICGYCPPKEWDRTYKKLIGNSKVFQLDLRRIPNGEVADLFETSHYFIMPYQDIAQSGAMTVAFNYNLPIIASNIISFQQFIEDGLTGYLFEKGSTISLAEKMGYAIEHHDMYCSMQRSQRQFIDNNLSTKLIIKKYNVYLTKLLNA